MQLHKLWWRAAAVRALKTMAQTAVAMLPGGGDHHRRGLQNRFRNGQPLRDW